jgi:hypothetical protein
MHVRLAGKTDSGAGVAVYAIWRAMIFVRWGLPKAFQ